MCRHYYFKGNLPYFSWGGWYIVCRFISKFLTSLTIKILLANKYCMFKYTRQIFPAFFIVSLPAIEPLLMSEKSQNNLSKDDKIPQTQSAEMPHNICYAMCRDQFEKSIRTNMIGIKEKLPARPPGGLEQNKTHIFWALLKYCKHGARAEKIMDWIQRLRGNELFG